MSLLAHGPPQPKEHPPMIPEETSINDPVGMGAPAIRGQDEAVQNEADEAVQNEEPGALLRARASGLNMGGSIVPCSDAGSI